MKKINLMFNVKDLNFLINDLNTAYKNGANYFLIENNNGWDITYSLINLYEEFVYGPDGQIMPPFTLGLSFYKDSLTIELLRGEFFKIESDRRHRLLINVAEEKYLQLDSCVVNVEVLTKEEFLAYKEIVNEIKIQQARLRQKLYYKNPTRKASLLSIFQDPMKKHKYEEPEDEQINLNEFLKPEEDENSN